MRFRRAPRASCPSTRARVPPPRRVRGHAKGSATCHIRSPTAAVMITPRQSRVHGILDHRLLVADSARLRGRQDVRRHPESRAWYRQRDGAFAQASPAPPCFARQVPGPVQPRAQLGAHACCCRQKSPGSRLRPPFFGDVTFFHTVPDAARWRRSTRQVRLSPAPPAPARGPAYSPAPRTDPARACRQEPRLFPLLTLARSSIDRHRGHPHKSAAQRTAGAPTPMNLGVGTGPKGCARKRKYTSTP